MRKTVFSTVNDDEHNTMRNYAARSKNPSPEKPGAAKKPRAIQSYSKLFKVKNSGPAQMPGPFPLRPPLPVPADPDGFPEAFGECPECFRGCRMYGSARKRQQTGPSPNAPRNSHESFRVLALLQ